MRIQFLIAGLTVSLFQSVARAETAQPPAATPAAANTTTNIDGPRIQFATPVYDFGRVPSGTLVKHDFVFTNIGATTVEITNVVAGCGCTTIGDWTRKVEPGTTGVIPIQFNSAGYATAVNKTPTVYSNDKIQPVFVLRLNGVVYRDVEVNPGFLSMSIPPDSTGDASGVVHIRSNGDEPLILTPPESNLHTFKAEIKTNTPGKDFDLVIKTVPPLSAENAQALIFLHSSSKQLPDINVIALAAIEPLVVSSPNQVAIPVAPLDTNQTFVVMIKNQSTNAVALTDPIVNAPGVTAKISALEPGKLFIATLSFPTGFTAPTNEAMALTLKTDRPRFPTIRVPIVQASHAAPPVPKANAAIPVRAAH